MSLRLWLIKKLGVVERDDYDKIVSDLKSSNDECCRLREKLNNPKIEIKQTYLPIETLSGYITLDEIMLRTMSTDYISQYITESATHEIAKTLVDKKLIEFSYDHFVVNPYTKAIKMTVRVARPDNCHPMEDVVGSIMKDGGL
jgi:hypothetical protein